MAGGPSVPAPGAPVEEPFCRVQGAGRPVLLLHGVGASSHIFGSLMQAGQGLFRFYAVDLPHTGGTGGYAQLEPEALADFLAAWCTRQGLDRFYVVGHSFGGVVGLELAARHPGRVLGLVLASAPALGLGRLQALLGLKAADWAFHAAGRLPRPRQAAALYLRRIRGSSGPIHDEQLDGYLKAAAARRFFPAMLEALRSLGRYRLRQERFGRAPVPVRVLWGEADPLVPARDGERLARLLRAPLWLLPGTGHCVPEERPESVLAALQAVARAPP